jgi:MFS family permease
VNRLVPHLTDQDSKVRTIFRVASGNFLEMFDFMIFGYYASAIARTFFPSANEFSSLMLSLCTFGAGFLMRPIGAIVLGTYIDRHGRRKGLLLTLALMSVGTLITACTPGYSSIGIFAPLLILIGRLVQGLSAGVELGGVSVYLSEIATPGHKGFYVSFQSASQQAAVIFAACLGMILNRELSPAQIQDWGWRLPMLVGCMIVPFLFVIRSSLKETEEFLAKKTTPSVKALLKMLRENWRVVVTGCGLSTMSTVSFYLITAYTPTFGGSVLHLAAIDSLIVTLCVGISNLIWLPLMAHLSDRIGRKPILIAATMLSLTTGYIALAWLAHEPSFLKLLVVELWLSLLYASYNGAVIVYLTEIMPVDVRTSGFSLAYSLATALFGGFTPAVSTYLIHETGSSAAPALWLAFAAVCGIAATLYSSSKSFQNFPA